MVIAQQGTCGGHHGNPSPLIEGKLHDLGDGFTVRRMLPVLQARHVGPMVLFDHIGPAEFADDEFIPLAD